MPVRVWAYSVMMRGMSGTPSTWSPWAIALVGDREDARVAEDGLVAGLEGRVALVGRLDVGADQPLDLGHAGEEPGGHPARGLGAVRALVVVVAREEGEGPPHLLLQRVLRARSSVAPR